MLRVLAFVVFIAIAASGAVWLADRPGDLIVNWQGYRIETSVAVAAVSVILFALVVALTLSILRTILRVPSLWALASRKRRKEKGYAALSRGMIAIGSGDTSAARRHSAEADRLLGDAPLALLLKAQSAQARGDRPAAENAFKAMLDGHETRVLGLRGLYVEARRRGDEVAADAYASEAVRLAPAANWASEAVFARQCNAGAWEAARLTLDRRTALGLVPKDEAKRGRAALLTAEALAQADRDPAAALRLAQDALKFQPGLTPAAVLAGKLLARRADLRKAAKVLEAAWRVSPHPDLAETYIHLRGGDSAQDRLARAQRLARLRQDGEEGALALAGAALDARDLAAARAALAPLLNGDTTARTYLLAAEIEEVAFGPPAGREWLARAARAPRDPSWIADGVPSDRWQPWSPTTGALGAFRWQRPLEALHHPARTYESDAGSHPTAIEPPPHEIPVPVTVATVTPPVAPTPATMPPAAVPPAQTKAETVAGPAATAPVILDAAPAATALAEWPDTPRLDQAKGPAPVHERRPVLVRADDGFRPPVPDDPGLDAETDLDARPQQPRWFHQA